MPPHNLMSQTPNYNSTGGVPILMKPTLFLDSWSNSKHLSSGKPSTYSVARISWVVRSSITSGTRNEGSSFNSSLQYIIL